MKLEGMKWEREGATCSVCGGVEWYDDAYDAIYCPSCDTWLEGTCSDVTCTYCRDRPARPSDSPSD